MGGEKGSGRPEGLGHSHGVRGGVPFAPSVELCGSHFVSHLGAVTLLLGRHVLGRRDEVIDGLLVHHRGRSPRKA